MTRTRLALFISLILFLFTGLSVTARFQEDPIQLTSWNIEVWPEYDQSSVLVIYNATVDPDSTFPKTMRIPVPAGVSVTAVAEGDSGGGLFTVQSLSETTENGQTVVFDIEKPNFVVEFYADVLSDPPSRSFELTLLAPYAAAQGSLSLRQPARASDMQITPALAQTGTDSLGNPLYSEQLGPFVAGQEIPLSVAYIKADADPSVTATEETAPSQSPPDTETGTADWLPLLVGGLIAVLVGAIAIYLLLQWRQRQEAKSRQVRRREDRERGTSHGRKSAPVDETSAWQNAFCPKCGRKYDAADKFCRNCGAQRY